MKVEIINRSGYTETEQDVIRNTGEWYMVHELEARQRDSGPVYHGAPAESAVQAEQLALGLSELFPNRVAAAVGMPYGATSGWPLIVACLPDGSDFPGPGDRDLQALVTEADRLHTRLTNQKQTRRDLVGAYGPGANAQAAPAGPDLTDHLYQNKQAFPQSVKHEGCGGTIRQTAAGDVDRYECDKCGKVIEVGQREEGGAP